jgi:hypothetical protein
MEPLNDDELKHALRQWKAPDAPASLERRVLGQEPWWRWLLTGSVRVPVPALLAFAAILVAVYVARANATPISCAATPEHDIVTMACVRLPAHPSSL